MDLQQKFNIASYNTQAKIKLQYIQNNNAQLLYWSWNTL